jgi:molybdenum cofactor cytidylyltransferase
MAIFLDCTAVRVAEYWVNGEKEQKQANAPGDKRLFAIVLAAGSGSRFGGIKQLARYDGTPLVAGAVRLAEAVCGSRTVLVAGYEWRAVVHACQPLQGFFTNNIAWRSGMGGSIACGVRAVSEVADAVLLMLADQPLVTVDHLRRLIAARGESGDSVAVTSFAGTEGPPVIFPASCFGELGKLEGDQGARAVLEKAGRRKHRVAFEPAALDIDVPRDLEGLETRSG